MKPVSTQKWGTNTAVKRYGSVKADGLDDYPAANNLQAPQDIQDQHCADYNNDTPKNWLRGMPGESAEGKPSFDKSNK